MREKFYNILFTTIIVSFVILFNVELYKLLKLVLN